MVFRNLGGLTKAAFLSALYLCATGVLVGWLARVGLRNWQAQNLTLAQYARQDREVIAPMTVTSGRADRLDRMPADTPAAGARANGARGVMILQLGDSHTSADFFTGELRKLLQARYGDGGPGYVTAGHPHTGVRSATLKITNSQDWTYKALQKSTAGPEFLLSGFNAVAASEGSAMTFAAARPVNFDAIEVEAIRQPGGGAIEIQVNGAPAGEVDLASFRVEPSVLRIENHDAASSDVWRESSSTGPVPVQILNSNIQSPAKEVTIKITKPGLINLSSLAIYNKHSGLIYNSVGFPGATINIINKFDENIFIAELKRLNPQIVVLSFGSNEGFDSNLNIGRYEQDYMGAIGRIGMAVPSAAIVIIGPPDGADIPQQCRAKSERFPCQATAAAEAPEAAGRPNPECIWRTPDNLHKVREVQRKIARRKNLVFWNWASIMPSQCGADQWMLHPQPLMAKDHLHLTKAGYNISAERFASVLTSLIDKLGLPANDVSNH